MFHIKSVCLSLVLTPLGSDWRWQKQVSDVADYAAVRSLHSSPGSPSPLYQRSSSPYQVSATRHLLKLIPSVYVEIPVVWSAALVSIDTFVLQNEVATKDYLIPLTFIYLFIKNKKRKAHRHSIMSYRLFIGSLKSVGQHFF